MTRYPDPADVPAVVTSDLAGLVFVASLNTAPGMWYAVEASGQGGYRCRCEGFRRRQSCRHTKAAWQARPLLAPATESSEDVGSSEWWDAHLASHYQGPAA